MEFHIFSELFFDSLNVHEGGYATRMKGVLGIHVSSTQGDVTILSAHEWNANFTTPLLCQMER
jgi:hypothetical protein